MKEPGIWSPIRLGKSTIHGWGVFADGLISLGQTIETAPGILINQNLVKASYYLMRMEGISDEMLKIDQYATSWDEDHIFLPLGWVGLYNHSENPSACFSQNLENQTISVISLRQIFSGEEITVNYGENWWNNKTYLRRS